MLRALENLFNLARERKRNPVEGSYTNKLLTNKSLTKQKILEEIETKDLSLEDVIDKYKQGIELSKIAKNVETDPIYASEPE